MANVVRRYRRTQSVEDRVLAEQLGPAFVSSASPLPGEIYDATFDNAIANYAADADGVMAEMGFGLVGEAPAQPLQAAASAEQGPATQILEASGQLLDIQSIADGEQMQRSGTDLVGVAPGGGGTVTIACCPFGAKSDDTGDFLIANGKSSDGDSSSKAKTRQPIAADGTLVTLAYRTKDGDTSTQMKVHINGVVEATVILSSMSSGSGVEAISVAVVAGDYVEIEYDAAQEPGECTMYFLQELS